MHKPNVIIGSSNIDTLPNTEKKSLKVTQRKMERKIFQIIFKVALETPKSGRTPIKDVENAALEIKWRWRRYVISLYHDRRGLVITGKSSRLAKRWKT